MSRLSQRILSLAILGMCSSAGAIEPIPDTSGWSGFVTIGGGVADVKTNMVAGIEAYGIDLGEKKISSLADEPDSGSVGLPQLDLNVNYTFASRTQLFLGNSLEDVLQFDTATTLGARQQFGDKSIIELAFVSSPALGPVQVWRDPYVVGSNRKETDRTSRGLAVEYDKILGSGFGVRYSQRSINVDQEQSGTWLSLPEDETKLLDRDGDLKRLLLSYRFPAIRRNLIEVRLGRLAEDLDGKAMSGDQNELHVTHAYLGERFTMATNLFFAQEDFDASNPVFDKKRSDDYWGVGFVLLDRQFFNSKQWWGQAMIAWFEQDSNIAFYDAESLMVTLGAQYRF